MMKNKEQQSKKGSGSEVQATLPHGIGSVTQGSKGAVNEEDQKVELGQRDQIMGSPKKKNRSAYANKVTNLPPGVEGPSFGSLFVEIGEMEWFIYNGLNYL